MKPVSGADVQIIAIAVCCLFIIGIGVWFTLLGIKSRLDRMIELLKDRPPLDARGILIKP